MPQRIQLKMNAELGTNAFTKGLGVDHIIVVKVVIFCVHHNFKHLAGHKEREFDEIVEISIDITDFDANQYNNQWEPAKPVGI